MKPRAGERRAAMRLVFWTMLGCGAAWGQTHTVTVRGAVKDSPGAAVENAAVSVINGDQQRRWDARTGYAGECVLVQIPPGNYALAVEAPGFKRCLLGGICG
jgi:hypothetical protein